jgi:hypothetical protein
MLTEEQDEVREMWHQYILLVKHIYDRLKSEGKFYELMVELRNERNKSKSNCLLIN